MTSFHFSAHPTYCLVSQYQPSGTGGLCSQLKYHTDCKIPYGHQWAPKSMTESGRGSFFWSESSSTARVCEKKPKHQKVSKYRL